MAKKLYVVGNWKMHKTARESTDYIEALLSKVKTSQINIYLAVPFTSIAAAALYAKDTNIVVGAQNMNDAREGAFTGEIAGLMLKEAGAAFVLLGHSERRHSFQEGDALIHRKVLRALQDDIQPILCIGETAKERDAKKTEEVIQKQLLSALQDVPKENLKDLLVAYEPVWAIGTGKTPTPKEIQAMHAFCRECLATILGKQAGSIPILYGGSVKSENVADIVAERDVNGVLVGGASLDSKIFAAIIQNIAGATKASKPRRKRGKK